MNGLRFPGGAVDLATLLVTFERILQISLWPFLGLGRFRCNVRRLLGSN